MFVLSAGACSRQLLRKVVRNRSGEALHDARIKGLLDRSTGLLHLGLLFLDGGLRCAILKDAAIPTPQVDRERRLERKSSRKIAADETDLHHVGLVLRHFGKEEETGGKSGEEAGKNLDEWIEEP